MANINIRIDADLKQVKKLGFDISLLTSIIKELGQKSWFRGR